MMEKEQILKNYINEFKKLSIEEKNKEVINKLQFILSLLEKISISKNIQFKFLQGTDNSNILNIPQNQDEYLQAIMIYVQNIEELFGLILQSDIHYD